MNKSDFYQKWLEHFAVGISERDLERYVVSTGNYLWHIFSWELLERNKYCTGDAARAAYEQMDKKGAMCIDWFFDEQTVELEFPMTKANTLDRFTEIYVVSPDFSWTYMKTHESMCGPYFMKL